jgi:hypothetical protein
MIEGFLSALEARLREEAGKIERSRRAINPASR